MCIRRRGRSNNVQRGKCGWKPLTPWLAAQPRAVSSSAIFCCTCFGVFKLTLGSCVGTPQGLKLKRFPNLRRPKKNRKLRMNEDHDEGQQQQRPRDAEAAARRRCALRYLLDPPHTPQKNFCVRETKQQERWPTSTRPLLFFDGSHHAANTNHEARQALQSRRQPKHLPSASHLMHACS